MGDYEASEWFGDEWRQTHEESVDVWPENIQIQGEKMFVSGKLCVPESLTNKVIMAQHQVMGAKLLQKEVHT